MKLLLTSAGLVNKTIIKSLQELAEKPFNKLSLAFVPTAANVEDGGKEWLIDDLINLKKLSFLEIDLVDISALPKDTTLKRLSKANILMFGGGNTFHLMHWMKKSGVEKVLPKFLKSKIYIGISAGSCVVGPTIYNSVQNLFEEKYPLKIERGLGLVKFQFIPHLNSPYFKKIREKNLKQASKKMIESVYVADDNTAVMVNGDKISVVSEGAWLKFN